MNYHDETCELMYEMLRITLDYVVYREFQSTLYEIRGLPEVTL